MTASLLGWLTSVPLGVLYLLMAAFAAVENVFPPVPADTVVALGSWLAARGEGSAFWAFFATWIGNVAGAGGMYALGRRHGPRWMHRRFPALADEKNERRLRRLYERYGAVSLVLSRFIPGVRAIVPPFAGALRMRPVPTMLALSLASAVWYGLVSYVAFRAGSNWASLTQRIASLGRITAVGAAAVIALALLVWWVRRRRRTA